MARSKPAENSLGNMSKWQKIESAPKEGTVLLFDPSKSEGSCIGTGYWLYDNVWMMEDRNAEPTHWMPLPEPPKEEE